MSGYKGDFAAGGTVYFKFTTRQSTGAPATLGGTPAISIYKDNSTTQSTSGITLTTDFDSVTGLNHVTVDTSADGTFYSNGSLFSAVITTGTVNSVSVVGEVAGTFGLRAEAHLLPTTAGRTLDVSATGEAGIDWNNIGSPTSTVNLSGTSTKAVEPTVAGRTLDVSATGEAGVDWANVGSPTTVNNLSSTTISAVSGAVGSVTGNVGGNVTGSVGSVTTVSDKTGYRLSATGVDDILDEVVEGTYTMRQFLRLYAAALGSKLSGAATTTITIRDTGDSKDRVTATVDADGNRSTVVLDLT